MFNRKQKPQVTTNDEVTLIAVESLRRSVDIAASIDTLVTLLSDKKVIDRTEFTYLKECILSTPTYREMISLLEAIDDKTRFDEVSEKDTIRALENILEEVMQEGENNE